MHSSRFLTKKVFPVDNPSAIPLTEIPPWASLWAQNFLKAPLRGGGRCAPRARARVIVTESKKLVRTQNLAGNDTKNHSRMAEIFDLCTTGLIFIN